MPGNSRTPARGTDKSSGLKLGERKGREAGSKWRSVGRKTAETGGVEKEDRFLLSSWGVREVRSGVVFDI